MGKKTKIIIVLLLSIVLIGLSSCKKEIKELKVSGSVMSQSEIENYISDYRGYKSEITEGKKRKNISENWYNFSSRYQIKSVESNSTSTGDISMSGDFYDSFATTDMKANIKMDLKVEMTQKKDDITYNGLVKGKLSLILVDGLWWIKGKISFNTDDSQSYETKIYKKSVYTDKITFDIDGYYGDIMDDIFETIDEMLPFFNSQSGCIVQKLGSKFISSLDAEKSVLYKTKKGFMLEETDEYTNTNSEESSVVRELYEFEKDTYIPKNIQTYSCLKNSSENYSLEITSTLKIKKKLMGIINAPINKSKYGW